MRSRAIKLMALTTCLLITGLAAAQLISSNKPGANLNTDSAVQNVIGPAPESATAEEMSPPTSRPERGPSALETDDSSAARLSTRAVQGVIELLQAGVDEEVLLKHIQNSPDSFNVSSDEIVFLTDLGAPGHVISAMMDRDKEIHSGQSMASAETQTREPWPPAGTVAEVPATDGASFTSATLPATSEEPVGVDAPDTGISVDYFYDYLAPYGTWIDVPEYGLCWQPTVAVSASRWMPYGDRGRWVYTDYGWYWYSDYSWGWAAFHYGRWFHHTRWGWCWAPGTVWGPSWVSWRYSDPYCGWAPLPPYRRSGFSFSVGFSWGIPSWCYTYVLSYRICHYHPRRYAVHHRDAHHIHGRSRGRDHYAVGRNHTIENRGIPPQDLTDNVNRDIRRATIKPRHEMPAGNVRRERLNNDGTTLTVYQPRERNRTTARPQTASRTESSGRERSISRAVPNNSRTSPRSTLSAPPESPVATVKAPTRTRQPVARPVRSEPSRTVTTTRTRTTPATRKEPAASITRSRTITTQTPSVNRSAPRTSSRSVLRQNTSSPSVRRTAPTTPQFRSQPTKPATGASSTRQIAPPRTPTRSVSRPSTSVRSTTTLRAAPSVTRTPQRAPSYTPSRVTRSTPTVRSAPATRSAPTVRSAPPVSRAPQRAPSYKAPPPTRSTAPTAPKSAPRSAPPGRSGDRSGGRSR